MKILDCRLLGLPLTTLLPGGCVYMPETSM